MHDGLAEADYCGLYKTDQPHHWVVVWEEFGPWFEQTAGWPFPFPTHDWPTRAKVVAAFFQRVFLKYALPDLDTCAVKVGLCTRGLDHLHVLLENVVLKGGVSRG